MEGVISISEYLIVSTEAGVCVVLRCLEWQACVRAMLNGLGGAGVRVMLRGGTGQRRVVVGKFKSIQITTPNNIETQSLQ